MGDYKSSSKKEVYSDTAYLRKQEKSQINNLTLHLEQLRERRRNKTQS